ncbi:ethanolamine ammonia-lyase subunit EutB [Shigella sonnei]
MVGFIGPEHPRQRLRHYPCGLRRLLLWAKPSGISMGGDRCYTNHADADQNLNENLMIPARHRRLQLHHGHAAGR